MSCTRRSKSGSTRSRKTFRNTVDGARNLCIDLTTLTTKQGENFLKQFNRTVICRRDTLLDKCYNTTFNPVPKQDQDFIDLLKWALLIVIILVFIYSFWKILQPSNSSLYRFIEFFVLFVCGFLIFSWFQKFWYGVNLF